MVGRRYYDSLTGKILQVNQYNKGTNFGGFKGPQTSEFCPTKGTPGVLGKNEVGTGRGGKGTGSRSGGKVSRRREACERSRVGQGTRT